MDIGIRVRELREERGLFQEDLARRAGVARNTVSRIERGDLNPTATMIERLSLALGVEPGDLFPKPRWPAKVPMTMDELLDEAGVEDRHLTLSRDEFFDLFRDLHYRGIRGLAERVRNARRAIDAVIERHLDNASSKEVAQLKRLKGRAVTYNMIAQISAAEAAEYERQMAQGEGEDELADWFEEQRRHLMREVVSEAG